jgi:hypothetical protein
MYELVGPKHKENTVICAKGNQVNIPELWITNKGDLSQAVKPGLTEKVFIKAQRRFLLSLIISI